MRNWKNISNFALRLFENIKKYKYETNFITLGSRNG